MYFILAKITGKAMRPVIFLQYKVSYFYKKNLSGRTKEWFLKRGFLQSALWLVLLLVGLAHTTLVPKKNLYLSGQKTIAYAIVGPDEEFGTEEIIAETTVNTAPTHSWREGLLDNDTMSGAGDVYLQHSDPAAVVAGGTAITKPIIVPGSTRGVARNKVIEHIIEPGDSLGGIAYQYGISIETLLWENKLTAKSIIRPGNRLLIPPTTGVMHSVAKGDTISKIAKLYRAKEEDVIRFNALSEDGTNLAIGDRIMVPNGTKVSVSAPATAARTPATTGVVVRRNVPGSTQAPSASGYVWPSGARLITQYFGWKHTAIDIAGPKNTPTYAVKSGTVETAQCGWNSGYGCYIIINHGGGVKTLYGHHNTLLVAPGDRVEAGQTIGLMGNTGNVRGVTGIHLHFEIRINGTKVNPLGYVK